MKKKKTENLKLELSGAKKQKIDGSIAIVGIGCYYPGANCLIDLWENILSRRGQFRQLPDQRLPSADYYNPDASTPDQTYGRQAAVLDGFEFDWVKRRIPKTVVDSTDIVHWLALEVAIKALEDAGYSRETVPTEQAGVILGNTLTGEQTRSNTMRLRWPFVRRALQASAQVRGLEEATTDALMETMEQFYKSVFAPITEDTLAGGLSNTIAGRICNFFDLDGGGYTVDGACSSSLIAVVTAANALNNGDLDLALAGGVDISLDTFELIGFAKTGALTKNEMRVYDRRASGFIPGEGCGFAVLKRLADARRDGNYVYAVLNGWGISSDGKGGLTAPSKVGQSKALRRAYAKAGCSPHTLHFIEGHGTGTPVGDRAELEGIALAMSADGETKLRSCGITSFKSLVGHTKAAAGIGGLIKAVMAVNQRIVPPTFNCQEPNPLFASEAQCLYPVLQGEIHPSTATLRAGVSAMGFGGINSHVTLSSGDAPAPHLKPFLNERALLVSNQDSELFILNAHSITALLEKTQKVIEQAKGISLAELVDLAACLTESISENHAVRAALIVETPDELINQLQQLEQILNDSPPIPGEVKISVQKDLWVSNQVQKTRIAFLFPGQGSQRLNMARTLIERHEWAREFLQQADNWLVEAEFEAISSIIYRPLDRAINQQQTDEWFQALTAIAPQAICFISLLWQRYLKQLGIKPMAVGGHSLGELTAFAAAGAYDEKTLLCFAAFRGRVMNHSTAQKGIMASLTCSQEKAQELLKEVSGYVVIANLNSPEQTVISGEMASVQTVLEKARTQGIQTRQLAVANAFHSQFMQSAAHDIKKYAPISLKLGQTNLLLLSSINGQRIQEGLPLKEHFAAQTVAQVNFIALVKTIANECDLMLEIGPARVLSGLVQNITDSTLCLPLESKPGSSKDFNTVLACYFVHGGEINWKAVYENRLTRPFICADQRLFIDNPCERPFQIHPEILAKMTHQNPSPTPTNGNKRKEKSLYNLTSFPCHSNTSSIRNAYSQTAIQEISTLDTQPHLEIIQTLVNLVVQQTGYPAQSISLDAKLLDDLNLDSIKAGELIAAAAKEYGVAGLLEPSTLANATLKEVAQVLQDAQPDITRNIAIQVTSPDLIQLLLELVAERTGFPRNTLTLNLRLLDDLNIDSIKAADLIATMAKKIGVSGKLDPSTLANATLADVIAAIQQTKPEVKDNVTSLNISVKSNPANWVRNFAIEYVPQNPVSVQRVDWSKSQVLLVYDLAEDRLAKAIAQQLLQFGAMVQICTYTELTENPTAQNFSDYIAILPQMASKEAFFPLSAMVSRLQSITTDANASANLAYVQFGGGYFGSGASIKHPEVCCAAGFAHSVHLERPQTKIRVIDLATNIPSDQAAQLIISELESTDSMITVGYNAQQVRLIPQSRLQQPIDYTPRDLTWSSEDVILVTGGAKGITAECALAVGAASLTALAQKTGVKMALVGRSPATGEVTQTLNRFQAQGLTCRYYACDIAQFEMVQILVHKITQDLGQITGVIHGAGLNQPRRVEQVSFEAALMEVSPKLLGAYNLLEALSVHPPKLFLTFNSIIGVTGMPGNSWYAFANESLTLLLRHFQNQHQHMQIISLAYSVWDEIGMGAKLGSVKHLERMGIKAISPQEGVTRFLKLFECDPGVSQVVIAARLGGLDTWSPTPLPKVTGLRFIEQVLYIEPNVELTARTHLTLERDLYVGDHLWRGSYLFPTVFGLEAMAQSVAYLTGLKQPPIVRIADISLRRPIVVDPTTGVTIEIQATLMEVDSSGEQRVKVGIRTEQTGFSSEHFSATLILGELKPGKNITAKLGKALTLDPKTDLYGDLLFQGKRFQRMEKIFSLDEKHSVFRSHANLSLTELLTESFAPTTEGYLLLGDPYFRDVLLQSVQLTIPQDICLPVEIGNIEFFAPPATDEGVRTVTVSLLEREGREYLSEVMATDAQGNLLERLTGYRLKILEEHPEHPTARELANPDVNGHLLDQVLQKAFRELGLTLPAIALGYAPNLRLLSKTQRRSQEQAIVARALKTKLGTEDIDFQLKSLTSGKPTLTGTKTVGLDLSLSHCDRYCLCVIGENPQGCDIEAITSRSVEDWIALLSIKRSALLEKLVKQGDTYEQAGTRIWSAVEAIRKAFNNCEPEFSIVKTSDRVVILKTSTTAGEYWVVTVPVKLTRPPERMIALVLPHKERSLTTEKLEKHTSRYTHGGPQGQLVYEQRFQVSFKESGSISRHIYFSQYFRWIGKIRELPMESIASEILNDFLSGDWGMVTNAVSLRVLGEATAYDIIQARAWIGNVVGSSFDTYIEFCKVLSDHSLERLAIAEVKATWVKLMSYGVPTPMPFPDYLQSYLDRFAAQVPASLDLKRPETLPLPQLPTSLSPINLGSLLEQTPVSENRYGRLLRSEVFQTTLEESNLVGNVYYSNYFIWQGRILDLFLYSVAPKYLRVSNPRGEMVCLYSRMDYLREAMPFDRIETRLYVQSVSERGAVFCFEFFRLADGSSEKLHVGQQEVAWVIRDEAGRASAAPWPTEVLQALR